MLKKLLYLIGFVILAVLLYFFVDLKTLWTVVIGIKYSYLIYVFLLCVPLLGFKAWRWKIFMDQQGISYNLPSAFCMYSVASLFSLFIPGKMGDASKIFYLSQDKHNLATSFSTIFLDRLFDLLILVLLALLSLLFFASLFSWVFMVVVLILGLGLLLISFFLLKNKKNLSRYYGLLNFFIPAKYHDAVSAHLDEFFASFSRYNKRAYLGAGALTVLSFLVYLLQVYILALALSLQINFFVLIPMVVFSNVADLLPISFNGIGTRESIFILFFKLLGLPAEKAVALGILQLSIVLFSSIIGLLSWLKKPLKFRL